MNCNLFSLNRNKLLFTDILAINTYNGNKRAYSINPRGSYEKLDFEFDNDSEAVYSCSVQWQNHNYVFGGWKEKQQISIVNGNRLKRKATLSFNFVDGGCTVLNEFTIVLCFDSKETKLCRQSNNPLGMFTKLPDSNFDHKFTRIASFDGKNTIY